MGAGVVANPIDGSLRTPTMKPESIASVLSILIGKGRAPGIACMTSTLTVPIEIPALVHAIEGGGYWAEVPSLPGCVAQADTLEGLRENMRSAIADWMAQPVKTDDEARQLAALQGTAAPAEQAFPQSNAYRPPPAWSDRDE